MKTKRIFSTASLITLFILSLTVISSCNEYTEQDDSINTEQLTTLEIKVEGMTCTGCETHITNAIMELSGINHAKLSHTEGNAIVEFNKLKISKKEIVDAINGSGYKAVE